MATVFATALAAEPDPNRVSLLLRERIEGALAERDILHGPLHEGQPQFNLNLTDRHHVFIKVARPGAAPAYAEDGTPAMGPVNELASAAWAHRHGIRVPNPLVTEPLWILDETGERRAVTVWPYLDHITAPETIVLGDRTRDVLAAIRDIATVPAPKVSRRLEPLFYRDRVRARLHGRADLTSRRILAAAETHGNRTAALWGARRPTWLHTDLHLGNAMWGADRRVVILDWESAAMAPVETDLSQLLRSILNSSPRHAASEKERVARHCVAWASKHLDIDWDLVDALIRYRAASHASHLLLHGHNPLALETEMALLDQRLRWLPRGH